MIRTSIVIVALMSIVSVTSAQPQPDTIDSLARGWSGGRSTSLCQPVPVSKGESVSEKCDWLLPQSQRAQGEVSTTRYKTDSAMVYWQRELSVTEMHRVVDSLGYALKLRGLAMRLCRPSSSPAGIVDAKIWEDKKLLVYISAITPASFGPAKLLVIGTDSPETYPDAVCPKRRDTPGH